VNGTTISRGYVCFPSLIGTRIKKNTTTVANGTRFSVIIATCHLNITPRSNLKATRKTNALLFFLCLPGCGDVGLGTSKAVSDTDTWILSRAGGDTLSDSPNCVFDNGVLLINRDTSGVSTPPTYVGRQ
jgi:hypothetical protein